MSRYNTKYVFDFITQIVHPKIVSKNSLFFPKDQIFWDMLVDIGSRHLVLPSIYSSIKKKKYDNHVPDDLLDYLKQIYLINKRRNQDILKQINFIRKLFDKNNIDYLFLKGAALLLHKPYDTIGERMIGDIDILVTKKQIIKSQNILKAVGFEENKKIKLTRHIRSIAEKNKHLERLISSRFIAAVELHKELLDPEYSYLFPANEILKIENRYKNKPIPRRKMLWKHTIFNWQYNDYGLKKNMISLRSLIDVVHLESENINFNNSPKAIRIFYSIISTHYDFYLCKHTLNKCFYKLQLKYPTFEYINSSFFKLKFFFRVAASRLLLFVVSKKYRSEIFNNYNLIYLKIKNFFSKV